MLEVALADFYDFQPARNGVELVQTLKNPIQLLGRLWATFSLFGRVYSNCIPLGRVYSNIAIKWVELVTTLPKIAIRPRGTIAKKGRASSNITLFLQIRL